MRSKISLVLLLALSSMLLSAQDMVFPDQGDPVPCRIVRNVRKEKIYVKQAGIPIENFYKYIVVEYNNDSIRIISPEQIKAFMLLEKNDTTIFYSLPSKFRTDYKAYTRGKSYPKLRIFYRFEYRDDSFSLLSRLEVDMLEMDRRIFLLQHSDSSIMHIHSRKELFRILQVPADFRKGNRLRNLRGEWNMQAVINVLKRRRQSLDD